MSQLRYHIPEEDKCMEKMMCIGFNQNKENSSLFKEFKRVIKMKAQSLYVLS